MFEVQNIKITQCLVSGSVFENIMIQGGWYAAIELYDWLVYNN